MVVVVVDVGGRLQQTWHACTGKLVDGREREKGKVGTSVGSGGDMETSDHKREGEREREGGSGAGTHKERQKRKIDKQTGHIHTYIHT